MRKYTLFLFFVLISAQLMSQSAKNTVVFKVRKPAEKPVVTMTETQAIVVEEKRDLLIVVEENATFMGGDLETFRGWVLEHLKYPEGCADKGIEGKVILSFVVNAKGNIDSVTVLRKVDPLLDQEAIRVIKSSPKWVAGSMGGKKVNQQFTIPVTFKLQR